MGLTRIRAEQISDIDYKQAVRVAILTDVNLTGGAPSQVDGVNVALNDRILVAGQTDGTQNGLYFVYSVGAGSNGIWYRTADANNATGEMEAGMIVMVTEGTQYGDTQWKLTTDNPVVVGTSIITFEQNSAYAFGNVYANGTAILADTVGDTITYTAGNNFIIAGNATTSTVTFAVTNDISVTGNISAGNLSTAGGFTAATLSAVGNITGGNIVTSGVVTATGNLQGANLVTGGLVTSTGNITGGNLVTGGLVTATGNIKTSANLVTAGAIINTTISTSGNITGANLITGGLITATGNIQGGNLRTSGLISATGNITGGNVAGTTISGNLVGTTASLSGNVTGGNLVTGGLLTAVGNIVGSSKLLVGTGSSTLTNPVAVLQGSGTTYVQAALYNSQSSGSADWIAYGNNGDDTNNWADIGFTGNSFSDPGYGITGPGDGYFFVQGNANTGGNLVISTGTLGTTRDIVFSLGGYDPTSELLRFKWSTSTILPYANVTVDLGTSTKYFNNAYIASLTASTLSAPGNITAGNLLTSGLVSATGNITGGNVNTAGLVTATGNIQGGNLRTAGLISATGNLDAGNLRTAGQVTATGNVTGGNVLTSGIVSATGNITGGNVAGATLSGNLVGTTASLSGNVTGGNILTSGLISSTGNLTSGNINTAGLVTATGNIQGGNLRTAGLISATGNVTGGNVTTAGLVTATGNVTGGNVLTAGQISAAGNVTGANINGGNVSVTGTVSTSNVSTSGNILVAGYISAVGNLYVANIVATSNLVVQDPLVYFTSNATYPYNYEIGFYSHFTGGAGNTYQHTGFVRDYTDATWKLFSNVAEPEGAAIDFTNAIYDQIQTGNAVVIGLVTATGNVVGANITTAGLVTATGNVTGGNVTTAGLVTATGNVTGGNITTGGVVTATGNIQGGNLRTTGVVSATGNITGGNLSGTNIVGTLTTAAQTNITSVGTLSSLSVSGNVQGGNLRTAGLISATGNVNGGNLVAAGEVDATTITATGNVVGGNILTAGLISATGNVTGGNLEMKAVGGSVGLIRWWDNDNTQFVAFKAPNAVSSNVIWTLPSADGVANTVLTTDGAGTLSWATASGGGGAAGYFNSTLTSFPGSTGNIDYGNGEAYVGGVVSSDAFGIPVINNYDMTDPQGSLPSYDLGAF